MVFFQKREAKADPAPSSGLDELRERLLSANLPEHARLAAEKELARLKQTEPSAAEYAVGLNYLDLMLDLPWNQASSDSLDLDKAAETLAGSHYGLEQITERMLEYLASRSLSLKNDFHVLVVDDEEIARTNLCYVLSKEGYKVRGAANGLEALNQCEHWEFDCILTDLKMDAMDGMELISRVRETSPRTQVVMITGYATVNSAVQAMRQGAVYYLAKPINLDELRTVVAELARQRAQSATFRSPVLCFSGPPGTGKTSVGQAVARSLGRKFERLSLAGLRDEAELRGHRRTYVGALPGRIIQSLARLKVNNPVFMLDEMDKIGQDFRGDPASVFLEILDPEQNSSFVDYYLDVPFNLSRVIFIATANELSALSAPLLDRLEVVDFNGYSRREKTHIAKEHILPRQFREHGLTHPYPEIEVPALETIIDDYTREAGVRQLDRELARLCRKLAKLRLEGKNEASSAVDAETASFLLGPRRYLREAASGEAQPGVATGLVYSPMGGEIITVETSRMPGRGQLILTGSLGEILRESAQTALSYARSRAMSLGLESVNFAEQDVHVHIPAGSVPKEGASAGLTLAVALISLCADFKLRRDVAMTGEITLSGRVLAVGGIREKVLAAARAGARRVILPQANQVDAQTLSPDDLAGLEICYVSEISQALPLAKA